MLCSPCPPTVVVRCSTRLVQRRILLSYRPCGAYEDALVQTVPAKQEKRKRLSVSLFFFYRQVKKKNHIQSFPNTTASIIMITTLIAGGFINSGLVFKA